MNSRVHSGAPRFYSKTHFSGVTIGGASGKNDLIGVEIKVFEEFSAQREISSQELALGGGGALWGAHTLRKNRDGV